MGSKHVKPTIRTLCFLHENFVVCLSKKVVKSVFHQGKQHWPPSQAVVVVRNPAAGYLVPCCDKDLDLIKGLREE